eukprot:maker-scaffold270_size230592-snap-gene-1.19 protein:Tk10973 transcript:maker-scaffold270_size230592-snap-gene-1.19-mRNA-1 annotation:"hypothetical protein DAPPUDRAFT_58148"
MGIGKHSERVLEHVRNSKNETSQILTLPFEEKVDMAALIACSLVFGTWLKRIMFRHLRSNGRRWSIQRMLLFDQVGQLATFPVGCLQMSFLLDPGWIHDNWIPWICHAFEFASMSILSHIVVGGCCLALFRTFALYNKEWVRFGIGERNLSHIMIASSLTLTGIFSTLLTGFPIFRHNFAHNLCTGDPQRILQPFEGILLGIRIRSLVLCSIGVLSITEAACYLSYFVYIWRHERSVKAILDLGHPGRWRSRRRRVAVTMFGSFVSWVLESLAIFSALAALGKTDSSQHRRGNEYLQIVYPHAGFIIGPLLSVKGQSITKVLLHDYAINLVTVPLAVLQIIFLTDPGWLSMLFGTWICNSFDGLSLFVIAHQEVSAGIVAVHRCRRKLIEKGSKGHNSEQGRLQSNTSLQTMPVLKQNCSAVFLDDGQYSKNGILRYERIFGHTFVSTGGLETTQEFTKRLNLQPGMRVLDIGCGTGGSAFFLARKFGVHVLGVDLSNNMLSIAEEHRREMEPEVQERVTFKLLDATSASFPDGHFDLLYSRDAIMHIAEKEKLYSNVFRWLKPGGQVLVSEYIHGNNHPNHPQEYIDYIIDRGYQLLTVKEYGDVLKKVGFVSVEASDVTDDFVEVLKKEMTHFRSIKDDFIQDFSEKDYNDLMGGWEIKVVRCNAGDQSWGFFRATKPSNARGQIVNTACSSRHTKVGGHSGRHHNEIDDGNWQPCLQLHLIEGLNGLSCLNELTMEKWRAFHNQDGPSGSRNALGQVLFPSYVVTRSTS